MNKVKFVDVYKLPNFEDNRGSFSNWLPHVRGIFRSSPEQINISHNYNKGTIRGLHYQKLPEKKIVTCLNGKIFDVVVDCRVTSATYGEVQFVTLDSKLQNYVVVPEGCAHGFQTITDNAILLYFHDTKFDKKGELGINAFDPILQIPWPLQVSEVSERDLNLPNFNLI